MFKRLLILLLVAFAGVAVWIGAAGLMGREAGWVSWAIGLAIGWSGVRIGARGFGMALLAAILSFLAAFGGRVLVSSRVLETQQQQVRASRDQAAYARLEADAPRYLSLFGREAREVFLRSNGYRLSVEETRELMIVVSGSTIDFVVLRHEWIDLIYALLSVATAFGLVASAASEKDAKGVGPLEA